MKILKKLRIRIKYYFAATYRRKKLDSLLEKNKHYYQGFVLDIGGRNRGKFQKPKQKTERWTFADIEKSHSPDIVLDIANMKKIHSKSVDVVNAIEVLEHVANPHKGLKECHRILKPNGIMILSIPFLFQIHSDPYDFQRWTAEKLKRELETLGFIIDRFEIMGRYFTVIAEMNRALIKSFPKGLKYISCLSFPLLDLLIKLDHLKIVKTHPTLGSFHAGYFIVAKKRT